MLHIPIPERGELCACICACVHMWVQSITCHSAIALRTCWSTWLCLASRLSCRVGPQWAEVSLEEVCSWCWYGLVWTPVWKARRGKEPGKSVRLCVTSSCSCLGRRITKASYFALTLFWVCCFQWQSVALIIIRSIVLILRLFFVFVFDISWAHTVFIVLSFQFGSWHLHGGSNHL